MDSRQPIESIKRSAHDDKPRILGILDKRRLRERWKNVKSARKGPPIDLRLQARFSYAYLRLAARN
jgi:hypothetical protein